MMERLYGVLAQVDAHLMTIGLITLALLFRPNREVDVIPGVAARRQKSRA